MSIINMIKLDDKMVKSLFPDLFKKHKGIYKLKGNGGLVNPECNADRNLIKKGFKIVGVEYNKCDFHDGNRHKIFKLGRCVIKRFIRQPDLL